MSEDTLRTRIEVVGAEEAKATLADYFRMYKEGTQSIDTLNTGLREQSGYIYGARRSLMLMRTDWRMQHAAWLEGARALSDIGRIGRNIVSMWQAYSVAQIRVTQAEQNLSGAHERVSILQDQLNALTAQGKMSSEEYYDTLVKITEAQIGVKDASVAVSKAQQENIIGYFGMALQVGNVASSLIMLNMHMKLLTGLTIGQTIATWAAAVAESAHAAAIWLKAHAMVVVMALTGVGLLVIAGLLAAAAAASASVSGIQAKAGRGMQMGGIIPETGWYYMHQYERVQRANASIGANITINVYGKDAKASAKTIGEELSTLRRRGVI